MKTVFLLTVFIFSCHSSEQEIPARLKPLNSKTRTVKPNVYLSSKLLPINASKKMQLSGRAIFFKRQGRAEIFSPAWPTKANNYRIPPGNYAVSYVKSEAHQQNGAIAVVKEPFEFANGYINLIEPKNEALDRLKCMLSKERFKNYAESSAILSNEIVQLIGAKGLLELCFAPFIIPILVNEDCIVPIDSFLFDPGVKNYIEKMNGLPANGGLPMANLVKQAIAYKNSGLHWYEEIVTFFDDQYPSTKAFLDFKALWVTIWYSVAFRRNLCCSIAFWTTSLFQQFLPR